MENEGIRKSLPPRKKNLKQTKKIRLDKVKQNIKRLKKNWLNASEMVLYDTSIEGLSAGNIVDALKWNRLGRNELKRRKKNEDGRWKSRKAGKKLKREQRLGETTRNDSKQEIADSKRSVDKGNTLTRTNTIWKHPHLRYSI